MVITPLTPRGLPAHSLFVRYYSGPANLPGGYATVVPKSVNEELISEAILGDLARQSEPTFHRPLPACVPSRYNRLDPRGGAWPWLASRLVPHADQDFTCHSRHHAHTGHRHRLVMPLSKTTRISTTVKLLAGCVIRAASVRPLLLLSRMLDNQRIVNRSHREVFNCALANNHATARRDYLAGFTERIR